MLSVIPPGFMPYKLFNRLGQTLELYVYRLSSQGRDGLFMLAPGRQASSVIGKNAEHFAFQLREMFGLDPKLVDFIEVRESLGEPQFFRWRFDWAGHSPVASHVQNLGASSQQHLRQSIGWPSPAFETAS